MIFVKVHLRYKRGIRDDPSTPPTRYQTHQLIPSLVEAGIVTLALNQQSAICHASAAFTLGVTGGHQHGEARDVCHTLGHDSLQPMS